jgi:secreted protein with Ig-like and vWFA domain
MTMVKKSCLFLALLAALLSFSLASAQDTLDARGFIQLAITQGASELDLGGLGIRELPPEIGDVQTLTHLNLSDNPLVELPSEIGQLENLRYLDLSGTALTSLPDTLWSLPNLETLSLRYVPLGAIPPQIGQLTALRQLDLRDMHLTGLPPEIATLTDLRMLDLGGNAFETLPEPVLALGNLEELHLHYTPLREIPPEIDRLSNLRLLDVRHTALTALPPEIGNLSNLQSLLLEDTAIAALPVEIGFLDYLTFLWTHNTSLPYDVTEHQSPANLDAILSALRTDAIASGRVPPARVKFINTYAEAALQVYGGVNVGPPVLPELSQDMFFEDYGTNPVTFAAEDHLSTFAMDVDTASYTISRSYIMDYDQLPPPESVRPEEFINYFPTSYEPPDKDAFAIHMDGAPSPFNRENRLLLRVGIQGQVIPPEDRDPALLVFVIDISGSMDMENRLGLVKESLEILVKQLRPDDRIGIVVYSDAARVVLAPTSAANQDVILTAIQALRTEGSTYAEAGLSLGYDVARANMQPGQITRVILCSDGVANVGETGPDAILETIGQGVDAGITLSTIGFGMGNFNDVLMEQLADDGNGNYFYVDDLPEARRIFVNNLTSTLQVIAYDAKVQVDFNPDVVRTYRLIGYENRDIADEDFRQDTVDAGEVGAGHSVTALYEIELVGDGLPANAVRYVSQPEKSTGISQGTVRLLLFLVAVGMFIIGIAYPRLSNRQKRKIKNDEFLTFVAVLSGAALLGMTALPHHVAAQENYIVATAYVRYETPDNHAVKEIARTFTTLDITPSIDEMPADYRLVVGVAEFAELLHDSPYAGDGSYATVLDLLRPLRGANEAVTEVIQMIEKVMQISTT